MNPVIIKLIKKDGIHMKKRRNFTPEFKTQVVLELLREEKELNQLATEHEIAPNMLRNWKKEFIANASNAFSNKKDITFQEEKIAYENKVESLYKTIGQLTVHVDWLKKNLNKLLDVAGKKELVTRTNSNLSISTQCKLLDLNRTSVYYKKQSSNDLEIEIKHIIDHLHTEHPAWGTRRITATLIAKGYRIGRKLVRRYMQEMRIYAIYPKPNLSSPNKQNKTYPYLLRNLPITTPNHVWSIDITYIPMGRSFMYLTAIIDWYSRYIVGYELSDTLQVESVITCVNKAIKRYGKPEIINSDQGSQFTSLEYTSLLKGNDIRISMDGKGDGQIMLL